MKYLLRMEGVNLKHFVFDSQDLSTVRGGGLVLLEAVGEVEKFLKGQGYSFEIISKGASTGLFELTVEAPEQALEAARQVTSLLHGKHSQPPSPDARDDRIDQALPHATFVVDVLKANPDKFVREQEQLLALNRFRQMQSPTVSLLFPDSGERPQRPVCQIDKVRPAARQGKRDLSESVWVRRRHGQKRKKNLYRKLVPDGVKREYTDDLDDLAVRGKPDNGSTGGISGEAPLNGKMAVIYIDGNAFGKLRDRHCRSSEDLKDFDQSLRKNRAGVLARLLAATDTDREWKTDDGKRRIETLLWGGDEIIWVVPAWKGWETLRLFYQESKTWTFRDQRLRHAAGMVFCNHHAPIHRVVRLAQDLADIAKKEDRQRNLFAYQILESFDHAGLDLENYRKRRWPPVKDGEKPQSQNLDGTQMEPIESLCGEIKELIPRRRLHMLAQRALAPPRQTQSVESHSSGPEDLAKELEGLLNEEHLEALRATFGTGLSCWLHLLDLWDYLPDDMPNKRE